MDPTHYTYDFDCLDNLKNVAKITSPILMFHSLDDEIIPFAHALKLYSVIRVEGQSKKHIMVQAQKLKHNQMHYFLSEEKYNPLNQILRNFLWDMQNRMGLKEDGSTTRPNKHQLRATLNHGLTSIGIPHDDNCDDPFRNRQWIRNNYKSVEGHNWSIGLINEVEEDLGDKVTNLGVKNHQIYFTKKYN
jgi:hypothetical protein